MRHRLLLEPEVHADRKRLPGNVRQRLRRAIVNLASEARPPNSRSLDVTDLNVPPRVELRRIRMRNWRIVYAVNDAEGWVWVLAIRRRPPYDYQDLAVMLEEIE